MRKQLARMLLLGAIMTPRLLAQAVPAGTSEMGRHRDVAATFDVMRSNVTSSPNFLMEGGSLQVHQQLYGRIGVVGDLAYIHTTNEVSSGVGLDLVTATIGPRYTCPIANQRIFVFGQALVGDAFGFNSVFPKPSGAVSSTNSLATQVGGGISFALSPLLAVRAIQADWVHTLFPNATTSVQNNLRVGAGIVFRFH